MSKEQIQSEQKDIVTLFSPEQLSILKKLGKRKEEEKDPEKIPDKLNMAKKKSEYKLKEEVAIEANKVKLDDDEHEQKDKSITKSLRLNVQGRVTFEEDVGQPESGFQIDY